MPKTVILGAARTPDRQDRRRPRPLDATELGGIAIRRRSSAPASSPSRSSTS